MALTPLHVQDVCCGGGWYYDLKKTCKYLDSSYRISRKTGSYTSVCVCTKLNAGAYAALQNKQGGNKPTGDNCQGYLLLYHAKQGYDLKKP